MLFLYNQFSSVVKFIYIPKRTISSLYANNNKMDSVLATKTIKKKNKFMNFELRSVDFAEDVTKKTESSHTVECLLRTFCEQNIKTAEIYKLIHSINDLKERCF